MWRTVVKQTKQLWVSCVRLLWKWNHSVLQKQHVQQTHLLWHQGLSAEVTCVNTWSERKNKSKSLFCFNPFKMRCNMASNYRLLSCCVVPSLSLRLNVQHKAAWQTTEPNCQASPFAECSGESTFSYTTSCNLKSVGNEGVLLYLIMQLKEDSCNRNNKFVACLLFTLCPYRACKKI